ncbi:MAG: type IX secretion system membrane protein PorP/SprF [Bacteroidetes bacterium]|nr:type IX secretion system membrane protein PorP/SprF [Fibrella sp.]
MIRIFYGLAGFLVLSCSERSTAQQDPQVSLFMFNQVYYNPAAAGSEGVSRFQLTHRTQYAGYQGSFDPGGALSTQIFSYNMPLASIRSGVGIYAFNDAAGGPQTNQSVQVSYAYRLALKNGTLSIGLQGGLFNKSLNYDLYRYEDQGDGLIPTGRYGQSQPDVGAGVYYSTTDYWVGLSMKHINQASFTLGTGVGTSPLPRATFLTAGYRLGIGYDLDVQPSILYQYINEPGTTASNYNINLLVTYQTRYFAGVSYRQQDAPTAMLGLSLLRNNSLRFAYAIDFVTGTRTAKSRTSQELQLSYSLPAPDGRKKPIVRTPRFRY